MEDKRVVITGMGVVSPIGNTISDFWSNLLMGNMVFDKPVGFNREYLGGTSNVSQIKSISQKTLSNYVTIAGKQALEYAELDTHYFSDIDLIIGSSEAYSFDIIDYSESNLKATYVADTLRNIANRLGIQGEASLFPVACSGGNVGITIGAKKIKHGQKKICLVGGSDVLKDNAYTTFYSLNALSKNVCKPFDKDRDGIIPGEGAAFLVLEELGHAIDRGVKILAEVTGYNISCDAYHATTPDPRGISAASSIQKSLHKSKLSLNDITYISPHGTGTYSNDIHEVNAYFTVFNSLANNIPISAIKSILGHCLASASAMEAIAIVKSIEAGIIPEAINTRNMDDSFPFKPYLSNFDKKSVDNVLSCSFAFGGNISTVIISKYK